MSYKYRQCPACFELSAAERPACPFCSTDLQQVNYHPWRRFFARWVDLSFILCSWSLMLALIIVYLHPSPDELTALQRHALHLNHPLLSYSLLGIIYISSETLLLAWFGNTPGKKLYRIRLNHNDDGKPSLRVALRRTFMLWTVGMGFGIPLLNLYAYYMARKRLVTTGTTLWDAAGGFRVTHQPWGFFYTVWVVLVSLIAYGLLISIYAGGQ